jgi:hypothetical protein
MGFIEGEARGQGALFPASLEELIPQDHFCRVIDAFVSRLDMQRLGFVRAEAAETGRPGYDPRDLLKLYLYGYLQGGWPTFRGKYSSGKEYSVYTLGCPTLRGVRRVGSGRVPRVSPLLRDVGPNHS